MSFQQEMNEGKEDRRKKTKQDGLFLKTFFY